MTHTKEPWRVEQDTALIWGDCNPDDLTTWGMGYSIVDAWRRQGFQYPPDDECNANARRIVECVNACAGLNPAAIPDVVEALRELVAATEEVGFVHYAPYREKAHQALAALQVQS